ncbi:MAG: AI-2E family transporter [Oscillospiraceae bacterium]|nr:AI-2E family transporter [Oscillospiraceae bacterium]
MKLNNQRWKKKRWVPYTIATCAAVALLVFLTHLDVLFAGVKALVRFVSPVLIGMVIAYILNPLVNFLQRKVFGKMKRQKLAHALSVLITLVVVLVILVVVIIVLVPPLANSVITLITNIGGYVASLTGMLETLSSSASQVHIDLTGITEKITELLEKLPRLVTDNFDVILTKGAGIGSGIFSLIIGIILAVYFMLHKSGLHSGIRRLLRALFIDKKYAKISDFWYRCDKILVHYIIYNLLDALIIGVANAIFMLIAGMPFVPLISIVVGVTNLAPTYGPIVGAVIGAFILVLVNPWFALWFLVFTIVLQFCDGYILKPKLFGDTLSVSPLWILICVVVLGRMFDVFGMLLAIPFAAISDFVFRDIIMLKLEQRKIKRMKKLEEEESEDEIRVHLEDDEFDDDRDK